MEDELITAYTSDVLRDQLAEADPVLDSRAHWTLGHAQRVAEGANLEIHRNTWRYNKLVEDQRRAVLEHRDRVLRTDAALTALGEQCPQRLAELSPLVDSDVLVGAARQIVLWHLDECWAAHLSFLTDLREGIHLRALARGVYPLDEFNREAIRAFAGLITDVSARSAETFKAVTITSEGADLAGAGLRRPTATWTYMVEDNPFGTHMDRAMRSMVRAVRKVSRAGDRRGPRAARRGRRRG
jgi:preprotein translocase subunit SecA